MLLLSPAFIQLFCSATCPKSMFCTVDVRILSAHVLDSTLWAFFCFHENTELVCRAKFACNCRTRATKVLWEWAGYQRLCCTLPQRKTIALLQHCSHTQCSVRFMLQTLPVSAPPPQNLVITFHPEALQSSSCHRHLNLQETAPLSVNVLKPQM